MIKKQPSLEGCFLILVFEGEAKWDSTMLTFPGGGFEPTTIGIKDSEGNGLRTVS